ncbi:MAG: DUF5686 family protein [Bacteroidales bacterium]
MRLSCIFYMLFLCVSVLANPVEETGVASYAHKQGDSIMLQVMRYADSFSGYVRKFDGEAYLKGNSKLIKKNFLFNWMPWAFPFKHNEDGCVFELLNDIHFEAPNHFVISPVAMRSSDRRPVRNLIDVSPLLNLNIYNATSFDDKYIMPGAASSKGIYEYRLDSLITRNGENLYKIRFLPRRKNLKVISGYLYITQGTPFIAAIEAEGYLDIAKFNLYTEFGRSYEHFMLPMETNIRLTYNIVNNISVTDYHCTFSYHKVVIDEDAPKTKKSRRLDLSRYYTVANNKIALIQDSNYWKSKRKYMLTHQERQMYQEKKEADSIKQVVLHPDSVQKIDYRKVSEILISTSSFGSDELKWHYSGVLNPSMIGYSKTNGIVIRQRLLLRKNMKHDQYFAIRPEVGFGFKHKEFFYRFDTDWLYQPSKIGKVSLSFRNGNKGFSSSFIDQVNKALDTTKYNFDHLNVKYYRDYSVQLENSYELTNGVMLYGGITYNLHKPVKKQRIDQEVLPDLPSDMEPLIKNDYADFVPYMRLSWTPRQYYRMIGHRKIHLPSPTPTLSLEYACGIAGILGSNSKFNKIEFDIHQNIQFSKLRSLSYRAGFGSFFNQKSEYFVDYRYFRRSNYPATWTDHIGGVFNLLDTRWYYASPQYAQLHLMYESPFILLHLFKRISRFILSERLYASQLFSPDKPSYTELGYGLGNYIFNVAVFTAFHGGKMYETGFRVSFELGRYW